MNTQTGQLTPAQSPSAEKNPAQDETSLLALASNPSIRYKRQAQLAAKGSMEVKCTLAKNPSLLPSIQRMFAEGNIAEIREALAANPKLDPACQQLLRQFSSELKPRRLFTLIPLASNPALTEEMQNNLVNYVDIGVVAGLARNPSIPESLMAPLSNCKLREILIGLACNSKLPEYLQAKLIAGGDMVVMENIARNSALTVAQEALLAREGSVDVRLALLENVELDEQIKARVNSSLAKNSGAKSPEGMS